MSDQCEPCTARGNFKHCEQNACHLHGNWYAEALYAEINHRDRAMVELAKKLDSYTKPTITVDKHRYMKEAERIRNIVERTMKKMEE